jgi:hypothetical protein
LNFYPAPHEYFGSTGRVKCYFEPSFSVTFGRKIGGRSAIAEVRKREPPDGLAHNTRGIVQEQFFLDDRVLPICLRRYAVYASSMDPQLHSVDARTEWPGEEPGMIVPFLLELDEPGITFSEGISQLVKLLGVSVPGSGLDPV